MKLSDELEFTKFLKEKIPELLTGHTHMDHVAKKAALDAWKRLKKENDKQSFNNNTVLKKYKKIKPFVKRKVNFEEKQNKNIIINTNINHNREV